MFHDVSELESLFNSESVQNLTEKLPSVTLFRVASVAAGLLDLA